MFDHGWADAFERAGGTYYPKLQIAVPFTPVPGPRLLGSQPQHLLAAAEAVVVQNEISSAHITFIDEAGAAECRAARLAASRRDPVSLAQSRLSRLRRLPGGADQPQAQGDPQGTRGRAAKDSSSRTLRGPDIGAAEWDAMWHFYQDTGLAEMGQALSDPRNSSTSSAKRMGDRLLLFLALRDGQPIAGALNLIGPDTLYGRYWGALEEVPFLHFELCYYQAIEWAIAHGLAYVQAGAQGEHKLARGYEPVMTRSAHFIVDPGFRAAVERFLDEERQADGGGYGMDAGPLPYRMSSSP